MKASPIVIFAVVYCVNLLLKEEAGFPSKQSETIFYPTRQPKKSDLKRVVAPKRKINFLTASRAVQHDSDEFSPFKPCSHALKKREREKKYRFAKPGRVIRSPHFQEKLFLVIKSGTHSAALHGSAKATKIIACGC